MREQPRSPADFSAIISGDDPPLIVGGQAVNIWAELYVGAAPELAEFEPFMSRDADILGTRALAVALAARAGWECLSAQRDTVTVAVLTKASDTGDLPLVKVCHLGGGIIRVAFGQLGQDLSHQIRQPAAFEG